jgi:hypothetical protein
MPLHLCVNEFKRCRTTQELPGDILSKQKDNSAMALLTSVRLVYVSKPDPGTTYRDAGFSYTTTVFSHKMQ